MNRTATEARTPRSEKILICDELSNEAVDALRARGFEPLVRLGLKEDALCEAARDAHALLVRSSTKITSRVIRSAPELKVVGRAGVGVDNVDVDAATAQGVVVMNAPAGNTTTTAELAIALLMALARNVVRGDRCVRSGEWKRRGTLLGSELTGKTLGVVGLGRIGRAVAQRGLGLEMNVLAHDPYLRGPKSPVEGVQLSDLEDLLARSDFVTLHVPFDASTRHLISRERIARMKSGARLINCARGGLVDEAALAEALPSGHLRGAAPDVFEQEPPPADHPLLSRDDVIVTPHLGASSEEAQRNVALEIAAQVADFLIEGVARNAVNLPPVSGHALAQIAPYVLLAEKLGSYCAQALERPLATLELSLSGEIARAENSHVKLALLVGALRQGCDTPLNFVNAPKLAAERGLTLVERADDSAQYLHSLVKVRAIDRGGSSALVAGSVFGREPRIVRIDEHHLDLAPRGVVLTTRHDDQPGVVGALGVVLGAHGVNIQRIELGPGASAQDQLARGFLALYDSPSPACLDALAKIPALRALRVIHL